MARPKERVNVFNAQNIPVLQRIIDDIYNRLTRQVQVAERKINILDYSSEIQKIVSQTIFQPTFLPKGQMVEVFKSGTKFSDIQAGYSSITDATPWKPYLVLIGPGYWPEFTHTNPNIVVAGVERKSVIITSSNPNQTILTADGCHFVNLTVENTATGPKIDLQALYDADNNRLTSSELSTAPNAFDGDTGTYWMGTDYYPACWWKFDLASNYSITELKVWCRLYQHHYGYKIEGSLDNLEWTEIVPGQLGTGGWDTHTLTDKPVARYIKIFNWGISGQDPPEPSNTWIYELEIYAHETNGYSIKATSGTVYLHNVQLDAWTSAGATFKEYEIQADIPVKDLITIDGVDISAFYTAYVLHRHDGHTLELDGINSDGGAFSFTTSGIVTFNQIVAGITPTAGAHLATKAYVDDNAFPSAEANVIRDNISINAIRTGIENSLAYFKIRDGVVDVFTDETGMDTGNCINQKYDSAGDYYEGIQSAATYGSDVTGGETHSADSFYQDNATWNADKAFDDDEGTYWNSKDTDPHWIKVDFGAGDEKTIQKLRVKQFGAHYTTSFKLQGSNNDADWDDIKSITDASSDGSWNTWTFPNSTAYRYYRLYRTSGSTNYFVIYEIEMMEVATWQRDNMTLISNSIEAEAEPSESRLLFLMKDEDAATLQTDIKGFVSLDDGTNKEQVTLVDVGDYDANWKIIAGTKTLTDRNDQTMIREITTHNNKHIKIRSWVQGWKPQ